MAHALLSWVFIGTFMATVAAVFAIILARISENRMGSKWILWFFVLIILRVAFLKLPEGYYSIFNFMNPEEMVPQKVGPWLLYIYNTWAVGSFFLLMVFLTVYSSLQNTEDPVGDPSILDLSERCAAGAGLKRVPKLYKVKGADSPYVAGFYRPAVYLPENYRQVFSLRELELALMHEMNHIRRGDVILNLAAVLVQVAFFFNPVVHYAFGQMRRHMEQACDEDVMAHLSAREQSFYGELLLKMSQSPSKTFRFAPAFACTSCLCRRIGHIAAYSREANKITLRFCLLTLLFCILVMTNAIRKDYVDFEGIWNQMDHYEKPVNSFVYAARIDGGKENGTGLYLVTGGKESVYAVGSGEVVFTGYQKGIGQTVVVKHSDGSQSTYGRCSKVHVDAGDAVDKGTVIAETGYILNNPLNEGFYFEMVSPGGESLL